MARSELGDIEALAAQLEGEALRRGTATSQALMLAGPVADREGWTWRALSAMAGRVDAAYLEDCRDEQHPLWVLGGWDRLWREHLEHEAPAGRLTLALAGAYLEAQLGYMAQQTEPDFAQFAGELRACRAHLEAVLHDSRAPETGAPCPACSTVDRPGPPLSKHWEPRMGAYAPGNEAKAYPGDWWRCARCGASWPEADYRLRVAGSYLAHADALTASELERGHGIAQGTLRQWANRGQVDKHGRDPSGRQLYDVAQALRARDARSATQSGTACATL